MAYSLIPPILVVLSLIGLIIFLVGKSSRVAEIKDDAEDGAEESLNLRGDQGSGNLAGGKMKNIFLAVLEKMSRAARMIFLKLESVFQKLTDLIRRKREGGAGIKAAASEATIADKPRERTMLNKWRGKKRNRKRVFENPPRPLSSGDGEERIIKPIISDKVVSPRTKTEIKDRLEDILIERIALNPRDVEAYERLGEYYMNIGSYEYSKECLKQVLKLDPTNKNARFRMRNLEKHLHR